jgi:hypothetical protein
MPVISQLISASPGVHRPMLLSGERRSVDFGRRLLRRHRRREADETLDDLIRRSDDAMTAARAGPSP